MKEHNLIDAKMLGLAGIILGVLMLTSGFATGFYPREINGIVSVLPLIIPCCMAISGSFWHMAIKIRN